MTLQDRRKKKNCLFFGEFLLQLSDLFVGVGKQQVAAFDQRQEFTQRVLAGTCFDRCVEHPQRKINMLRNDMRPRMRSESVEFNSIS